ncbi:hypothetical protein OG738_21695 [Amycolatopsis sp. NBC_01488]|uniref:hypothetical protein n=1 Tax=Amycolatopsis sp. NBC_01488 TaxID=2903563 RepID=UPI002E27BCDA|nr:hypothetical protein [Amycolatopsis sp. NBC_01488]
MREIVAAGLSESLGDQPQHLARGSKLGRDHLSRIGLAHRGIQREQYLCPPDRRDRSAPVVVSRINSSRSRADNVTGRFISEAMATVLLRQGKGPAGERPGSYGHHN